jgi:CHASE2 domain-containing sensor protein
MTFELIIGGLLGVILSYVIKYTSSRFYILKAVTIAITAWLFFLSPGTFFNLPLFKNVPPSASIIMLVGSVIWGFVAAITLKKLTKDFQVVFYGEEIIGIYLCNIFR